MRIRPLLLLALFGAATLALFLAPAVASAAPPLAERLTWNGFVEYWSRPIRGVSSVIQVVGLVAVGALLIIMSGGRWKR
jgi:hypothetical protein